MCDCLEYESEYGTSAYICECCLGMLREGLSDIACGKEDNPSRAAQLLYRGIFQEYHWDDPDRKRS